ncbi:hypothetical protein [Aquimarina sp. MMG016]|uniref:hypothetical protein n=1 Tax=Aquimarina sp. MMG016 TaxID=2822690 RepID=UPI001B3A4A2A|nr:hypothetical protein [Aquimarina sp. MMG016]MBQ4818875.1 hypothetical protein [Aquimarina sp. MMG016]
MKCIIKGGNNKSTYDTVIVRRKFVPIKFIIERENQFLNAGTKLPFATTKVNALLVTSKVKKSCVDKELLPKYYYGISDFKMTDTQFLADNDGDFYDGDYPPDGFSNGEFTNQWWYYVHPVLDRFPLFIDNGISEELGDPILLEFTREGQCTPDKYYLWSERLPKSGSSLITFFPPT